MLHIQNLKQPTPTYNLKPPIHSTPHTHNDHIYTANITPNIYIMIIISNHRSLFWLFSV